MWTISTLAISASRPDFLSNVSLWGISLAEEKALLSPCTLSRSFPVGMSARSESTVFGAVGSCSASSSDAVCVVFRHFHPRRSKQMGRRKFCSTLSISMLCVNESLCRCRDISGHPESTLRKVAADEIANILLLEDPVVSGPQSTFLKGLSRSVL